MNGPNENAMNTRSSPPTPAARNTVSQQRAHQAQLASVSSQRNGSPAVPEVWWMWV